MLLRRLLGALLALAVALPAVASHVSDSDALLLRDKRFRVQVDWRTADGRTDHGHQVGLDSETSAYFWFFRPDNTELVLKVIDACALDGHYWVFAAGLTNVEVRIQVDDLVAGETWTHVSPLGQSFLPVQDTAAFATCGAQLPACGQGIREEILATPRAEPNVEHLALVLGGGLTADPAIYERLVADLALIHHLLPPTQYAAFSAHLAVNFQIYVEPDRMFVELDDAAAEAVAEGAYDAWDCLNAWYGVEEVDLRDLEAFGYVYLEFDGVYDLRQVAEDYEGLAGIERAGPDTWFHDYILADLPEICVERQGDVWTYFLLAGEDDPVPTGWHQVTVQPGTAPAVHATFDQQRYLACQEALAIDLAP